MEVKNKKMNTKILYSVLFVGFAIMMGVAGSIAIFSDTERSEGNTFQAGALDLKIDLVSSTASYTDEVFEWGEKDLAEGDLFFNWFDIKPGDNGEATISVHVENNPALLWISFENLEDYEMGQTEPETKVDDTPGDPGLNNGELSENLLFTVWIDDGNNKLDPGETVVCEGTPAEEETIGPAYIENCCTYYLGIKWWVPKEVGNRIQTDSLQGSIVFYAEQARNNSALADAITPPCPGEGPSEECPGCPYGDVTESENIKILSVDKSGFPTISTFVRVNTEAGTAGDLVDDFDLCEEGKRPLDLNVSFTSGTSADIVFVFDDTGSMEEEIGGMKNALSSFVDKIENAGIDARYALVSFKDTVNLDQNFTDNKEVIQSAVNLLSASGGGDGREDDFDAIAAATRDKTPNTGGSLSAYRPDAQRVIIDITDAPAQVDNENACNNRAYITDYTMDEVEALLEGYTFIAISPILSESPYFSDPCYSDGDKQILAKNVGGSWFELPTTSSEEFVNTLVEEVGGLLTTTYTLTFTSCYPDEDGTVREILVVVDDPVGGMLFKTTSYTAPPP
ncbi:hypothetical protein AKJ51_00455 [candidate division MSBL1 archaeon SCGC-AAA382A20]|uniref:VWFA domain-containing protein n=1 Tax=candidate division MSBL1 archaeon SCGC-AAA382A20 TaxID=1698280 RepID=A0A133VMM3_9EURY|nr:hypothetical protein AKJ51_00455 [candidate division MSBL1 archaeon SCGC-AAA382A20]